MEAGLDLGISGAQGETPPLETPPQTFMDSSMKDIKGLIMDRSCECSKLFLLFILFYFILI